MQFNISAAIESIGSIVQGRLQGQLEGQLRQQQQAQQEYERAFQLAQEEGRQTSEQLRDRFAATGQVDPSAQPEYVQGLIREEQGQPGIADRLLRHLSPGTAERYHVHGTPVPPFPASGGTPGSTTGGAPGGGPGPSAAPGLGATAEQVREHAGAEQARQYAALNPTPQPVREFAGLQPASPMQSLLQGAVSPQGIQSHRFAPLASHAPAGSGLTLPPQQPSGNAPAAALAAAPAVAAAQGAAQVTPPRPTFMGFPANVGGEKLQAAITQTNTLAERGRNWILQTTPKDEAERAVFQRVSEVLAGPLETRADVLKFRSALQELAKYQTPGRDVVERVTAETPRQRQVASEIERARTAIEKSEVPPDHPLRARMQTIYEALGNSDPAVRERGLVAYNEIATRIGSGATAYAKHQEIKQQRAEAQRAHKDTVDARTQAHNDAVAARQMQLNLGLANAHPSSEAGARIAAKIAKDQGWGEFTPAQFRAATKGENGKLLGLLGKDVNEKAKTFKQQAGQFTAKDFTQQRWIDLWTHSKVERTRDAYEKAGKSYAALQAAQQAYNRTLHDSIQAAGGAPAATGAAGDRDTPQSVTINGRAVTISPAAYWEGLRRAVSSRRLTPAEANRRMAAAFGAR